MMKNMVWTVAILALVSGCDATVLDFGNGGAGQGSGGATASGTGSEKNGELDAPLCTKADPAPDTTRTLPAPNDGLAGTWTGYIESYTFQSGSSDVALVFSPQSDGALSATVTFGHGTPLPPPTSATEIYPPGDNGGQFIIYEGYVHTATGLSLVDNRLQLAVASNQIRTPWCELQTSYRSFDTVDPEECGCQPGWAAGGGCDDNGCYVTNPTTGKTVTVVRGLMKLCVPTGVCDCYESGCTVDLKRGSDVKFDMRLSDGRLEGTALMGIPYPIHLTRSP